MGKGLQRAVKAAKATRRGTVSRPTRNAGRAFSETLNARKDSVAAVVGWARVKAKSLGLEGSKKTAFYEEIIDELRVESTEIG
jgi:hypothetical protein